MSEAATIKTDGYFDRRDIVRDAAIPEVEIKEGDEMRVVKKAITKPVLNALVCYSDENAIAFPSMPRIADDTGLSLRSVQRGIAALIKLGVLKVVDQVRRTNVYQFFFDSIHKMVSKYRQKKLFKKSKPADVAENRDDSRNVKPDPVVEKTTEPKTVKAYDDVKRSAKPKFTPPGKTDGQQIKAAIVPSRMISQFKTEIEKLGIKKTSAIDAAIERGATPKEIADMIGRFPEIKRANEKIDSGALVYWLENGRFPIELKPTPGEAAKVQAFRSYATRIETNLVDKEGRAIDAKFLGQHYWPLVKSGLEIDEVKKRFLEICKQKGVRKY